MQLKKPELTMIMKRKNVKNNHLTSKWRIQVQIKKLVPVTINYKGPFYHTKGNWKSLTIVNLGI